MAGEKVSHIRPLPVTTTPRRLPRVNGPGSKISVDDLAHLIAHPLFAELFSEAVIHASRNIRRQGGDSR
jgi:hypothetical protein